MTSSRIDRYKEAYPYPRRLFIRGILRAGISFFTGLLTRLSVEGRENLPDKGPLIVVFNHFHFLDAVVAIQVMPWPLEFLADFEMPNVSPLLKVFPDLYGTYDVAQGLPNLDALRASEAILAQEGVLGIFPEGRIEHPTLRPALPGAAFVALRTGAPIVPVGIFSEDDWDIPGTIRREKRRLSVTCRIGEVFGPLEVENRRRPSRDAIDLAGEKIMAAIAAQLPPDVRGAYG
ncbi:MAG: lysophospholipid acyltransferase family protein [Chloroflexota bacterium]|nr:lysophospholipid acyltransferase family protein [Chloroflexota bacterium]